jgi:broad specificity phosphatase PhoE
LTKKFKQKAEHNVIPTEASYNRFDDPVLTRFGESQAVALRHTFPHVPDLIMVSPLRRTLQTMLLGLSRPQIPVLLDPGQLWFFSH